MNFVEIDDAVVYLTNKLKFKVSRLHLLTEIQNNKLTIKPDGLNFKVCIEELLEHYRNIELIPLREQLKRDNMGKYHGRWEENETSVTEEEFNAFVNRNFKE